MGDPLLATASLADVVVGGVFALVGARVGRRHATAEARPAMRTFGVWWWGIAASTALAGLSLDGGLLGLVAALGGPDALPPAGLTALVLAWTFLACVGLWGLLSYLVYLFWARRAEVVLAVAYVAVFALFAVSTLREAPQSVDVEPWGVRVLYARPIEGPTLVALLLLFVFPQIGGALAYGSLWLRTGSPAARYRIGLVAASLVAWLGTSLVASSTGFNTTQAWLVAERLLAVAASLLILAAYAPPRWLLARLGDREASDRLSERAKRLEERVRMLV